MNNGQGQLNLRLARAVHARWEIFHRALKRCRQKFATKAVHECRVEARRLLSTLELVETILPQKGYRKGRRPLRKCLKLLQPLRDVQVQERLARQSTITSLSLIRKQLAKEQRRHRKDAVQGIEELDVRRTKDLARGMEQELIGDEDGFWPEEAILRRHFLKRLAGLYRKVVALRREIDPGNVETIHRVRVAFKKFRYTIEPLREFLKEFRAESMRDIKAMQEALGGLQDTDVCLRWLDKWIGKEPEVVRPLAFFRHWLLCLRPQQIRASLHWIDRLPAEWQGGVFTFTPELDRRAHRGKGASALKEERAESRSDDRKAKRLGAGSVAYA